MSNATAGAIAHITEVMTRVTRILSSRQIKVVQQGMKVGVDYDAQGAPTAVYLPSLSENPSPELLTAIQGFLDKEVSTLLYTDFDARHRNKSISEFKRGMAKSIQDIIEDARTEREMRKQFKGSASNFDKNHDFAVKEILGPAVDNAKDQQHRMAALALPAIRAACGDLAYEEFMDGKWEDLGKLGGAILHYADEIQNVDSTEDTFTLTRKIIQKMEEQDGDGEGDGDEGEGESENGEGQAGCDSDGDGESDGSSSDGDGDGEGDGSEASGDEAKGDDGEPGDQKVNQDKVDLSKVNKSRKLHKPKTRQRGSGGSGTMSGLQQFDKLDDAFEDMDFDKKVADKIKKIAGTDAAKQGSYVPFSRQYDYVGPLPNEKQALQNFPRSSHAQTLLDNVDKNSHVIQQQIQKLFMAKALTRWEPGQRRGKINSTSLYKLGQGDPRIFRRKIESNSRDVAVALVVDMSGSMSGQKIQNACVAALMFSKVLTNLGIKHEISAFTTYSGYGLGSSLPGAAEVNEMIRNCRHADTVDGKTIYYSRVTPITNYILKPWDKRLNEDIRRITAMIPSGYPGLMSGNVDGESIDLAGRRLLGQKEKKKVMIVMSDGCPASDGHGGDLVQHLKTTVKNLSAAGVEMLGLGLQDNSVKQFYPKSEVVMAADQIPTKILELTKKMVVGV